MRVTHGHDDAGVTEERLDRCDGGSGRGQVRGEGMAKSMPADMLNARSAAGMLDGVLGHAARERVSISPGEDQLSTARQSGQRRNGVGGERDGPFTIVLWHAHDAIHNGLADGELAISKVDVLPPKAEQLS